MLVNILNSWWSFRHFFFFVCVCTGKQVVLCSGWNSVHVNGFCSSVPWKGVTISTPWICQAIPVSHTEIYTQHSWQNSPLGNVNNVIIQIHRLCVVEIRTLSLQMVHYPFNVLSLYYSRMNRCLERCPRSWRKVVFCLAEVQLDR